MHTFIVENGVEFYFLSFSFLPFFPKIFTFNANCYTFIVSVGAMYVCTLYAILFLKLWSYIQVNMWCRLSSQKKTMQGRMRRLSYNLQCKYKNITVM